MSDERLPEKNRFSILLVILSPSHDGVLCSFRTVVLLVVFLITHLSLETISLRLSQVVSCHQQGDCSWGHGEAPVRLGGSGSCGGFSVLSHGRICREGRSSSIGVSAARPRHVVCRTRNGEASLNFPFVTVGDQLLMKKNPLSRGRRF